jgi:hypothetical protein
VVRNMRLVVAAGRAWILRPGTARGDRQRGSKDDEARGVLKTRKRLVTMG